MTKQHVLPRIVSFGEGLVDFFPTSAGIPMRASETFRREVGGAPVNLAFGAARLGGRVAMISKFGQDEFGFFLREQLANAGVNVDGIQHSPEARTGITFVQTGAHGERSFLFYRAFSAELTFCPEDVINARQVIRDSGIVHSGTNLLMHPEPRKATLALIQEARTAGALISLDANLRLHLWKDKTAILPAVMDAISRVDLLKVNEDEHAFLFGDLSSTEAFREILHPLGVSALISTEGQLGSRVITPSVNLHVPADDVDAVDTTGAGDAFLATLLVCLSRIGSGDLAWPERLKTLDTTQWSGSLKLSNKIAGMVCASFGAVTGVPHGADVDWETLE